MSRVRLPAERRAVTKKFVVGGVEGYITVGLYEDGSPGELFVTVSKSGSTLSGLLDAFATSISLALQYGVPLDTICRKFEGHRFEPAGWTGEDGMGYACSIVDYVARWMWRRFGEQPAAEPVAEPAPIKVVQYQPEAWEKQVAAKIQEWKQGPNHISVLPAEAPAVAAPSSKSDDRPLCTSCGSLMEPSGACHRCPSCGSTSGCS